MVAQKSAQFVPCRAPDQPPTWVSGYIGLPFEDRGRTRDGLDCWGLVRLVYAERYSVALPSYADRYLGVDDADAVEATFRSAGSTWQTVGVAERRVGDVAVFNLPGGRAGHVGLVVSSERMLHVAKGTDSCLERVFSPTWLPRLTRIARFTGDVRVRGHALPLDGAQINLELPAGMTVAELVAAAGVDTSPYLHAYLGDREVPRDAWARVRPRPGRTLTIAVVPRKGDVLRIVATIALVVGAVVLGQWYAGAYLGLSGTALAAVSSGVTAGITIAGTLAINALIPPSRARLSDPGSGDAIGSPALSGARNQARPFQPIPLPLGEYVFAPPYGALPYTETSGNDQYLRCLFAWIGPTTIDEVRIGDTLLQDFDGVEVELRHGFPGEPPLSLYPGSVIESPESLLVREVDGWTQRTTATDADEISIDLVFPQGLAVLNGDGSKSQGVVRFVVEYSPAGAGTWTPVNLLSPANFRQLDYLTRTPEVVKGGDAVHADSIAWSGDGSFPNLKPPYLPWQGWAWVAGGYIYAPTAGVYTFGVDGSDAIDVHVDGREVASWYGNHLVQGGGGVPNYAGHTGTITLEPGWHSFRARVEVRLGTVNGGAIAVAWRKPGDAALAPVPAGSFRSLAGVEGQLTVAWFDHSGYTSDVTVTATETRAVRRTVSWAVPRGQYDVRFRRVTQDYADTNIFDDLYMTALRTIRAEDPLPLEGVAKLAIRIKATEQLNGVLDELNVRVRSILPDHDAAQFGAWVSRPTSNCASAYLSVLRGRGNKRPVADDKIDWPAFAAWHTDCVNRGFAFNAVIDFAGTLRDRLADIAAAGRATPGWRDGKHTIVRDVPQSVAVQLITPRNSWGFRGVKVFTDRLHAFRCTFPNQLKGFAQDERIVLADGYTWKGLDAWGIPRPDLPPATRLENLDLFGVTHPDQVFKHGRYHLAVAQLRPELYSVSMDFEHLACVRGDLINASHDVMLVGLASGRVLNLITDAVGVAGVITDEVLVMEAGKHYGLRLRLTDGTVIWKPIVTDPGAQHEVMFEAPIPTGSPAPAKDALFAFGELGRETGEYLVKSIDIGRDLSATLTLVDHSPAVHQADVGAIPPFDSGITIPPDYSDKPEDPVIESIRSDDSVMVRDPDGSLRARMLIQLKAPPGKKPLPSDAQVRTRVAGSNGTWSYRSPAPLEGGAVFVDDVEEGVTYEIRLRVITRAGVASGWVAATHTVVGKTLPPPDVSTFDVLRLPDGTRQYSWSIAAAPPDLAGVEIRYGAVGEPWENLSALQLGVLQSSPHLSSDPAAGTWRFGIKAVDTSGNRSAHAVFVERILGLPPLEGVAFYSDAGLAGWPGTKTDCHRAEAGNVLEADDHATWATLAAHGAATWDAWTRWVVSPKSPIVYEHAALDAGLVLDFTPDAYITADGLYVADAAWSTDGVTYTNWQDIREARGRTVSARYLKVRVYVQATAGAPVPVLRSLVVLMRAPVIVQDLQDVNTATVDSAHLLGVGDLRLPVAAGTFRLIRTVSVTFNGQGPGWSWELVDRDPSGPRVRLYDADHEPAHAVIDALVRGI